MDRKHGKYDKSSILPNLNDIFKGKVVTVKEFGAFIEIPGCSKNGLVHKSQLSKSKVDDVSEMISVGDQVWCKVLTIGEGDKISLSMKVVNQGNGEDLDPAGVQIGLDDKKRQSFSSHSHPKIELDAVFNTVCKKCGTKGHLAKDCFYIPGAQKYELLNVDVKKPSFFKEKSPQPKSNETSIEKKTIEKKSKKRKYSSDSSSSTDSSSSERKRRKKEKRKSKKKSKKKEHKKKKRSSRKS